MAIIIKKIIAATIPIIAQNPVVGSWFLLWMGKVTLQPPGQQQTLSSAK